MIIRYLVFIYMSTLQARKDRDQLQNQRKEAWVSEAELRKRVEGLQAELKARKAVRRDSKPGDTLFQWILVPSPPILIHDFTPHT